MASSWKNGTSEDDSSNQGTSTTITKGFKPDEARKFLKDFNPENSARERRKLTRSNIYKINNSKLMHDRDGRLIEDASDFCDCLDAKCGGCHFPCAKCGSGKCSKDCRVNRRWTVDSIQIDGMGPFRTLEQAKNSNVLGSVGLGAAKPHSGQ